MLSLRLWVTRYFCKLSPQRSVCREQLIKDYEHCFKTESYVSRVLSVLWNWGGNKEAALNIDTTRAECRMVLEHLSQSTSQPEITVSVVWVIVGTVALVFIIHQVVTQIKRRISQVPQI